MMMSLRMRGGMIERRGGIDWLIGWWFRIDVCVSVSLL